MNKCYFDKKSIGCGKLLRVCGRGRKVNEVKGEEKGD